MFTDRAPASYRSAAARRLRSAAIARPSVDVLRLLLLWAAWLAIICAFQVAVQNRVSPERPDNVLAWTPGETSQAVLDCRPRLADPFMNEHVAYDSEYYVSIAASGYDDPNAEAYNPAVGLSEPGPRNGVPSCTSGLVDWTSLDYAFMPGYPMAMRAVMATIRVAVPGAFGLTDTGLATLAGVIVAALGGLLAMLALSRLMAAYELRGRPVEAEGPGAATLTGEPPERRWGGPGGLRAAFYLLVFPTGFYLAQVYTEGLFVGLAFAALALAVERRLFLAAAFALLATAVRPTGVFLALPLAWAAFEIWRDAATRPSGARLLAVLAAPLVPVATFATWFLSALGQHWQSVESGYFSRSFDLGRSFEMWRRVVDSLISGVDKTPGPNLADYPVFGGGPLAPATGVYIWLEIASLVLGVVACLWLMRRMPGVAAFGLGVIVLSAGSSAAQGMDRYVLAVPAIFLMLAWFGRRTVVDRAWTLASTLLMGMLAMLFTFGFWVA